MEKLELKARLVEKCRKVLTSNIDNFEKAMADAQQQANEYGPPKDRYDAFRMKMLRQKDMLGQQMVKEMYELETLSKIDLKIERTEVGFGAVVITEEQRVFISVAVGKIQIENDLYFAISVTVPFHQAMLGKKKGEEFEFRGKKNRVVEIF